MSGPSLTYSELCAFVDELARLGANDSTRIDVSVTPRDRPFDSDAVKISATVGP